MPAQDKPYRVYRGGRVKGRVPLTRHARAVERSTGAPTTPAPAPDAAEAPATGPLDRARARPLLVLLVAWGSAATSRSRAASRRRTTGCPAGVERQLTKRDGLLVSTPTTILVLGTDGGDRTGRQGANRADSIMLLRTDPGKRRLAYLSIPRDLQVEIPEVGLAKINAANQFGGPALALRTVKDLTGLDVNHVVFVDFDRFEELIDAVGGIDVDVPRPIRSNRFDCPYHDRRALRRSGRAGGSRAASSTWTAAARSSTRGSGTTCCTPSETDFDRARRQQQVVGRDARQGDGRRDRAPAPVRRRRPREAARHRPERLGADAARLGLLPGRHRTRAPLPARRRPGDRRRRVRDPRDGGQRLHRRDVHRPVGTAPAAARAAVRSRMPCRRTERHASGFEESDFFASAVAAGFSDSALPPSVDAALESPSFDDLREPRP